MKRFKNYRGEVVGLSSATHDHIKAVYSEIEIADIRSTLLNPDEVRQSSRHDASELYYLMRRQNRYTCVVVKICNDGSFISTALTTSKPKHGQVIYRKEE